MFLQKLSLRNFRNYHDAVVEFSPGLNAFHGDNAQGKTSLLEAIYFLIVGRSFRTANLNELVHEAMPGFHLEAQFVKHGVEQRLKVSSDGRERKVVYNQTICSSSAALLGLLAGIVITPADELVKGAPQTRRLFLDLLLAQTDPMYIYHATRYNKALQQRNALLKRQSEAGIDSWEHEMALSAAYMAQQRQRAVEEVQEHVHELYGVLSGERGTLSVEIKQKKPDGQSDDRWHTHFQALFRQYRKKEMQIGYTLNGPHRDELSIALNGKELRFYGSEGQQRTCVAALRFAAWRRLKELREEPPLTLIDDLGVSLDRHRTGRLLETLGGLGQVFITSAEKFASSFPIKHFHVKEGTIEA